MNRSRNRDFDRWWVSKMGRPPADRTESTRYFAAYVLWRGLEQVDPRDKLDILRAHRGDPLEPQAEQIKERLRRQIEATAKLLDIELQPDDQWADYRAFQEAGRQEMEHKKIILARIVALESELASR